MTRSPAVVRSSWWAWPVSGGLVLLATPVFAWTPTIGWAPAVALLASLPLARLLLASPGTRSRRRRHRLRRTS